MTPRAMLQRRHYVFFLVCPVVPMSVCDPVPSVFFSLGKNTERISMKFAGDNRYHQQMKWLHLGRNCSRDKRAGYHRKFISALTGVAAMLNSCWRLVNEFTNFTLHSK